MAGCPDIISQWRTTRSVIGLVPQELSTDAFETVWATVSFSRGLFGKARDPVYLEKVLRETCPFGTAGDSTTMSLSGGMKRRRMIANGSAARAHRAVPR